MHRVSHCTPRRHTASSENTPMTSLYILLGLIAVVVLYVIFTYNALVALRVRVNEAWSGIEVHMKERYNLIPNLVETVKGYTKHEAETLENVTRARAEAFESHGTPHQQAGAENLLSGALKSLFALAENYPDLKANQSFIELQGELSKIEEKIQNARRYYNGVVRDNNTKVDQFPSNLIAGTMNFTKAEFFELEEADADARQPVDVKFD